MSSVALLRRMEAARGLHVFPGRLSLLSSAADIAGDGALVTALCVEYQPLSFLPNHLFPILLPPGSPAGVCRPENGLLPGRTPLASR